MAEQKAKVVKVGRGGPRGPRPKVQNPGKIFMRILRYVMECYRIQVVAVVICIFVSVFANVQGTLFMQTLIDGYILPLLKEQSSDFSGLAHAIARTAGFYGHRHCCRLCPGPYDGLRYPGHPEVPAR